METFDAIKKRRSIRKYMDIPLEWEIVGEILDAGRYAPFAGDVANVRFIIVTKDETKKKISDACLEQRWIESAPVLVVVCSDQKDISNIYGLRGEKFYSIQNCTTAIENILLAATSLGVGSSFVSGFNEDAIKRALKLPKHVRPQAVITLGYSDEEPIVRKPDLQSLVHFENWGNRRRDTGFWPVAKQLRKVGKRVEKKRSKTKGFLDKLFK